MVMHKTEAAARGPPMTPATSLKSGPWNRVEPTRAQETHSELGACAPARQAALTDQGKATPRRPQTVSRVGSCISDCQGQGSRGRGVTAAEGGFPSGRGSVLELNGTAGCTAQ